MRFAILIPIFKELSESIPIQPSLPTVMMYTPLFSSLFLSVWECKGKNSTPYLQRKKEFFILLKPRKPAAYSPTTYQDS